MEEIGIFYSFNTKNTASIAEIIQNSFKTERIKAINVETITEEEFSSFDNLILGVPTWFDGELPTYWDKFVPAIEKLNLKNKKIAIFGLGDQINYPENFVDGMGVMSNLLTQQGAQIIGTTSIESYEYENSKAEKDGKFVGLVIDIENQPELTKERIEKWIKQLEKEFN